VRQSLPDDMLGHRRRIDIGNRILGDPTLLVGSVEDRRSIARPDIVSLAITRARIVDLEEELEDLPIADPSRIKDDLDRFCMSSVIEIGRIGRGATRVADPSRENAGVTAKEILHAPKTTAGKHSTFFTHRLSSTWSRYAP
jgi:hypothetical protein